MKKKNGAGTEMATAQNCVVTKGLGSWAQVRVARRWTRRGAAGRTGRAGAGLGAGGRQAHGRGQTLRACAGGRAALALCVRPCAAWACCWASRLCTWCTQPVLTQF